MKIIAGTLRGRSFATPGGLGTRPALSRLRRSLFDTLSPALPGANFLDLYGGSGAFSFEALSRGAERAVIVELAPRTVAVIRENARRLRLEEQMEVISGSTLDILPRLDREGRSFDIIGVSPPYFKGLQMKTLRLLGSRLSLAGEALIFVQHDVKEDLPPVVGFLGRVKEKRYGTNRFTFYEKGRNDPPPEGSGP